MRRTIKLQLRLVSFIIIAAAIVLGVNTLLDGKRDLQELDRLETLVELSTSISLFVHETQKERGASAGYLGSKGAHFADKLPTQRQLSDQTLSGYKKALQQLNPEYITPGLKEKLSAIEALLQELPSVRKRVDTFGISVQDEVAYYTLLDRKSVV